jgi:hypothetical protein
MVFGGFLAPIGSYILLILKLKNISIPIDLIAAITYIRSKTHVMALLGREHESLVFGGFLAAIT